MVLKPEIQTKKVFECHLPSRNMLQTSLGRKLLIDKFNLNSGWQITMLVNRTMKQNKVYFWHNPFVVIIMRTSEKSWQKDKSDITVIWVSDWFKWIDLLKISSLMSQFSINKRTLSVFCCFLFAVFNNCWYTTSTFSFNYYSKQSS